MEALLRENAAEILALCARYGLDERQSIRALKGAGLKLMLASSLPSRRRELLLHAIENEARDLRAA
ncbi:MAG TPA: hypothetical protein VM599_05305, partial [Thermoanaerobaculia bacterium]|nr:hypothetical protein [Thermoanaerobaculia bacterium]